MKLLIVLLALYASQSSAAECDDVVVLENFSFTEFAGTYYQFALASQVDLFTSARCPKQMYELINTDSLLITNTQLDSNGNVSTTNGFALYKDATKRNGIIEVTMDVGTLVTTNYNVMAFQPCKFIIVHNCQQGLASAWILTTEKFPSDETLRLIETAKTEVYEKGGPAPSEYMKTDQTACNN